MTAEERADLQIAIDLIRDLSAKVDAIPEQTEAAIEKRMSLHLARAHANDKEVVNGFHKLMDERREHGALKRFFANYWRHLVALGVAITIVLEILERTHVI